MDRNIALFAVAASPNEGFLGQIAALYTSIIAQPWERYRPVLRVCFGGQIPADLAQRWAGLLSKIEYVCISPERLTPDHLTQVIERFYVIPPLTKVAVFCDADVLVTGPLEDMFDRIGPEADIAGCLAHFPPPGRGKKSANFWQTHYRRFCASCFPDRDAPALEKSFAYSGPPFDAAPAYYNYGFVVMHPDASERIREDFVTAFTYARDVINSRYFSAQVGLTLSLTVNGLRAVDLGMSYNMPNDRMGQAHLEKGNPPHVIHYLREKAFKRSVLFATRQAVQEFVTTPRTHVDEVLRAHLETLIRDHELLELLPEAD
ncbi:hypothetical protein [Palleronia caenipelagi]|uniref:Glycosyltransferase family 8 protein n=1 Tax=Palleronia caenipelagi TaxID=2489174 RepID=A0A547PNN0_9RHOB|nr:hypothetical protein [Palleronia caenipelagi]TRD15634.1 hypothetical protein FEV53_15535 [Palleronia caenipelagi]